jgi:acetate kinase
VHGGERFREPVIVDDNVVSELDKLTELAPLHNRPALAALEEARQRLPDIPHVAVFDTAFHSTMPEEATTYALPARWRKEWGIRRYGFHGLSVQWAAERVQSRRLVVCHLGGGCSVTAVLAGRSIDTTMGFSPLDGIPMATRSGAIDPEIVLHLERTGRLDREEIENALEHESGLLGLSGLSGRVEELEASDTPEARFALTVFCRRVASAVSEMACSLGGLDALVFTGGVGEGSSAVRAEVSERLRFIGVEFDVELNLRAQPDADITDPGAKIRIVVIHAREDVIAARSTRAAIR